MKAKPIGPWRLSRAFGRRRYVRRWSFKAPLGYAATLDRTEDGLYRPSVGAWVGWDGLGDLRGYALPAPLREAKKSAEEMVTEVAKMDTKRLR